jgi:ureidoglycolate lyase
VLTPLARSGSFLIVDRIGPGDNLEEHLFTEPWTVTAA